MGDGGHGGFIKLYRDLAKHRIWRAEPFSLGQAWVDLLMMANYRDGRILRGRRLVTVRRGQVLTSGRWLADQWNRDRKTVTAWFRVLEADHMITVETDRNRDHGGTLITILNYEKFQAVGQRATDHETDHASDTGRDHETDHGGDHGGDHDLPTTKEVLTEVQEGEEGSRAPVSMSARVEKL